jgi:hypothetical protein
MSATSTVGRLILSFAVIETTECFEESGTEQHIAIFTTFAFANVDDHALAVDVLDA